MNNLKKYIFCILFFCISGWLYANPVKTPNQLSTWQPHTAKWIWLKGENVIYSLVLQRHNKTSKLWPVRGGFILQLDTDSISLGTDNSWRARWAIEYKSDTPSMTHQYGQQQWVDGWLIPAGWQKSGFNDSRRLKALKVKDSEKYWPVELELRS